MDRKATRGLLRAFLLCKLTVRVHGVVGEPHYEATALGSGLGVGFMSSYGKICGAHMCPC